MATYKQEVIKIEEHKGDKGAYKLVLFKKKDGTTKERKVWGDLAAPFTQTGTYEVTYDDATHYLTAAKFAGIGKPGTGTPTPAPERQDERGRSIEVQCAMKAAAAVLSGKPTEEIVTAIPKVMAAFVDAFDAIEKADKEAKDMEQSVPF